MRAAYSPYRLIFKFNAGTSRGVLTYKDTYFIKVFSPVLCMEHFLESAPFFIYG